MTDPTPFVLLYYSNTVFNDRIGVGAVWHVAVLYFVALRLIWFLCTSEQGFIGFQRYNTQMVQGRYGKLVPLAVCEHRLFSHYSFVSFNSGSNFDSALALSAYNYSADINWTSVGGVNRSVPHHFDYGPVNPSVKW